MQDRRHRTAKALVGEGAGLVGCRDGHILRKGEFERGRHFVAPRLDFVALGRKRLGDVVVPGPIASPRIAAESGSANAFMMVPPR